MTVLSDFDRRSVAALLALAVAAFCYVTVETVPVGLLAELTHLARRSPEGEWSYGNTSTGLPDDRVTDLALDGDGSLWVACGAAAARLADGGVVETLDNMNGPPGTVLSVAIDDTVTPRRVIVGTSEGIGIYDGP